MFYNEELCNFYSSPALVKVNVLLGSYHRWEGDVSTEFCLRHQSVDGYMKEINPLNPELNPIFYLLALLAHHFLHVSRIRVKSLTIMLLMSYIYIHIYIYGAPILDVSRSHTTTQHSR